MTDSGIDARPPTVDEPGVCAVVVSYRPDLALLGKLLDALAPQVGKVIVVDNATPGAAAQELCAARTHVAWLPLPDNAGLAAGLNAGIAYARKQRTFAHVLLLDQDSVPETGMVTALKDAMRRLGDGTRVAAVGPRFRDPREGGDAPFVRFRFPFNRKLQCGGEAGVVACDFLITSGCLIPLAVLDAIGDMDAALFIDNVDLEWCCRASSRGYALFGVCAARMHHHHGDRRRHVPGLPRGIIVHTPQRLFYMMRNRVLLYRRGYTPARWIAQDVPRLVVKLLLFALLVPPRRENLHCMLAGLRAGVAGRAAAPPGQR